MCRIDELPINYPFHGNRQISRPLHREGVVAGRHRVRLLMQLEVVYRKLHTRVPCPEDRIFPYLLRGVEVERLD